jgi:hypothetical protein
LEASSRGERGISFEEEERGVVGEELDAPDFTDEPEDWVSPSVSSSALSIATVGKDCEAAVLKRRGWGRNLSPLAVMGDDASATAGGGEVRSSLGGGVTFTLGEDTARLPLSTELLLPPRLQDEAVSDLEGATTAEFTLFDIGLPREVPPLMTVVELGVAGGSAYSSKRARLELDAVLRLAVRLPNRPPRAAVMGT